MNPPLNERGVRIVRAALLCGFVTGVSGTLAVLLLWALLG